MKQDIIIRNLEVIGEATRALSQEVQSEYPEVAWKKIKGMRNFLVHEYFNVDFEEVWKTINSDIPILKEQIETILSKL